jgi:hypothetical protein
MARNVVDGDTEADNDGEDDERVGHWYERSNEGVDDELQRLKIKNEGKGFQSEIGRLLQDR